MFRSLPGSRPPQVACTECGGTEFDRPAAKSAHIHIRRDAPAWLLDARSRQSAQPNQETTT